jgi:putative membrane protein
VDAGPLGVPETAPDAAGHDGGVNTPPSDSQHNSTTEDHEPDYRFTLANERTFLAWVRTALGLVAGGVAVRELLPGLATKDARTALAALCIALAAVLSAGSYPRWRRVQRAMRRGLPLPRSPLIVLLAGGVLLLAVFAAVLVVSG